MFNLNYAVALIDDGCFEQRLQVRCSDFVQQMGWDVPIVQSNSQTVSTCLLRNGDRVLFRNGAERCEAAFGNSECRWATEGGCWLGGGAENVEWCELPIYGQNQWPFGAASGQTDELALEVQQVPIPMGVTAQDCVTVFVAKVTVVVEVAGDKCVPSELVAQFDGNPELAFFSEAGREVVPCDQAADVNANGNAITARRCFRSGDENLSCVLQKFVSLLASDAELLAVLSTKLIKRCFLVKGQSFRPSVIGFVHPVEFLWELRVGEQRVVRPGKCVIRKWSQWNFLRIDSRHGGRSTKRSFTLKKRFSLNRSHVAVLAGLLILRGGTVLPLAECFLQSSPLWTVNVMAGSAERAGPNRNGLSGAVRVFID